MTGNPLIAAFHESLLTRYPIDGVNMSTSEWMVLNTHINGNEFSFADYEFQKQIADDMAADLVVIKPSQVGATELQIRKTLAFTVRNRGVSSIYTLPSEAMYKRVSKTRIGPLIKSEKVFQNSAYDEKPLASMGLYELNGSFLYVTGMIEGDATSIPADFLAHDELDLSDQAIIALYQSRLQNSKYKITQSFSTPTHPAFGVDGLYKTSDKHEYMLCCEGCRHWQVPMFTPTFVKSPELPDIDAFVNLEQDTIDTLDPNLIKVVCERCGRPLNFHNPALREWVAEFPSRRRRGYQIRPFSTVRLPASYIFSVLSKYKLRENLKGFHNTVLGEAYSDGSNQLDEQIVRKVMDGPGEIEIPKGAPCAIGIDIGKSCHIVYGPIIGGVVIGARWKVVPDMLLIETVLEIMRNHNIVAGAVDRFPYTPLAHELMAKTNGVIVPVEYRGSQALNLKKNEFDELSHAQADRTAMIDAVVGMVRRGEMRMSGYGHMAQTLITHFCDMVRIETEEKPATWEKISGQDHFLHAAAFMQISTRVHQLALLLRQQETLSEMFGLQPLVPDEDNSRRHSMGFRGAIRRGRTLGTN